MKKRFYSFLSFPVFAVLYVHTAVMVICTLPFAYLRLKIIVRLMVRFWAKSIFWILIRRLRIRGKENFDPGKRYIIIANHASLFDIMAIMAVYPGVAWFGREYLLRVPIFRQILKMLNYIPMKEGTIAQTRLMLDSVIEKSKRHTIAIFPEGTRTLNGNLSDFYRGFAYILKATQADVLPITLNGFYTLKPKNRFHINFNAKLNVTISKPIDAGLLAQKSADEISEEMKQVIESAYVQPAL
ncbi:MAG: 1-acyl-sn-glycerol-3-phosphate acyltransferase [Bacteroidales bacterium]|nr:1-acyl-sn-glycerol-3-phosphate acyltransferase [Bacteroidales bacterium]